MKKLVIALLVFPFVFSCSGDRDDDKKNNETLDEGKVKIELITEIDNADESATNRITLVVVSNHLDELHVPNIKWNPGYNGKKQQMDFYEKLTDEDMLNTSKAKEKLEWTKTFIKDKKLRTENIIIEPSHPIKGFIISNDGDDVGEDYSGVFKAKIYLDGKLKYIQSSDMIAGLRDMPSVLLKVYSIKELRNRPDIKE